MVSALLEYHIVLVPRHARGVGGHSYDHQNNIGTPSCSVVISAARPIYLCTYCVLKPHVIIYRILQRKTLYKSTKSVISSSDCSISHSTKCERTEFSFSNTACPLT